MTVLQEQVQFYGDSYVLVAAVGCPIDRIVESGDRKLFTAVVSHSHADM